MFKHQTTPLPTLKVPSGAHVPDLHGGKGGDKSQVCLPERTDVGTGSTRQEGETRPSIPRAPRAFLEAQLQLILSSVMFLVVLTAAEKVLL